MTCAEDVQSQALALTSEDVSTPNVWNIEHWLKARSAVASAKQNRSGFFLSSNVPSSRKSNARASSRKTERFILYHLCQSDHFWRRCSECQSKRSGKGVKMDLARFTWRQLGVLIPELFETVVLRADVVLDCGCDRNSWWSRGSADFGGCSETRFF